MNATATLTSPTMKSSLTSLLALQRPSTLQAALRMFSAGTAPSTSESLRYLARPHYRMIGGKPATFAGDGRVFLWTYRKVPGFMDYEIPPGGMGYFDVPALLGLKRGFPQIECPEPAGDWKGHVMDAVVLGQHPARLRRFDLMRLNLLDRVQLGAGEYYRTLGYTTGWRTVGLWWKLGDAAGEGIILCPEPKAPKPKRK